MIIWQDSVMQLRNLLGISPKFANTQLMRIPNYFYHATNSSIKYQQITKCISHHSNYIDSLMFI